MHRSMMAGALALLSTATAASAVPRRLDEAPLPVPRPPELRIPKLEAPAPAQQPAAPAPKPQAETPSESGDGSCLARLQALGDEIQAAPQVVANQAACKISTPVSLHAVTDGRRKVRIEGELVLECRTAEALGSWLTGIAAPVLEEALGSPLRAVRNVGGYECRNRNNRPDGKISAHAQGLAVDLGAFELANGTVVAVANLDSRTRPAFSALRQAACGWFLTVLGPGADPEHASHLHLDLLQHGSSDRYRICQ